MMVRKSFFLIGVMILLLAGCQPRPQLGLCPKLAR
jgi:hypothetical protein